jgi:hypothetical protein
MLNVVEAINHFGVRNGRVSAEVRMHIQLAGTKAYRYRSDGVDHERKIWLAMGANGP